MNTIPWILLITSVILKITDGVSLYNYFSPNGEIAEGLVAEGEIFTLNGVELPIISGAFHYFRVHPQNWRITLRKLKAAGLNTVDTYMPWNWHNPRRGIFDFGEGGDDFSKFLDIRRFVEIAQEEELFVIIRPGPYICTEWDFGGLPSWLLRDDSMQVRSSYRPFTDEVYKYYEHIYDEVKDKFYIDGGSIIAIQIENEYGHFGYNDFPRDLAYMEWLKNMMDQIGFSPLLYFTSDSPHITKDWGALPGVLQMANFQADAEKNMDKLIELQPNRPRMVMEYWTGWFDHWVTDEHITNIDANEYESILKTIFAYNSSVNMYMFIGGTNFGFMAGANLVENMTHGPQYIEYQPITTSYDYGAPLTEDGNYGEKYNRTMDVLEKYYPLWNTINRPTLPKVDQKGAPASFPVMHQLEFESLVNQSEIKILLTDGPVSMEKLGINDGNGQSYGYIMYETVANLVPGSNDILIKGHVRDMAQLFVDGEEKTGKYSSPEHLENFGFWQGRDKTLTFVSEEKECKMQILVENLGRVNFGKPHFFNQRKGLSEGPVYVNNKEQLIWTAVPFEFKKDFINGLTGWKEFTGDLKTPSAYRVEYKIEGIPMDVFIDTSNWEKGVIFVNGFNLGRYWTARTPVSTMYVPAPLLESGMNEIIVFEQYTPGRTLEFIDHAIYNI